MPSRVQHGDRDSVRSCSCACFQLDIALDLCYIPGLRNLGNFALVSKPLLGVQTEVLLHGCAQCIHVTIDGHEQFAITHNSLIRNFQITSSWTFTCLNNASSAGSIGVAAAFSSSEMGISTVEGAACTPATRDAAAVSK